MITNTEQQAIIDAVISAVKTNSRTISMLTSVSSLASTDYFEVSDGKKVSYSVLSSLISAMTDSQIAALQTSLNNNTLTSVSFSTTSTTATLSIVSSAQTITCSVPIVSDTKVGFMTPADKAKLNDTSIVADEARLSAEQAVSTANTAKYNASQAVLTANTAEITANTANTNASEALSTANLAEAAASAASDTANAASTAASQATTNANQAITTANAALTTANSAETTAVSASAAAASNTSSLQEHERRIVALENGLYSLYVSLTASSTLLEYTGNPQAITLTRTVKRQGTNVESANITSAYVKYGSTTLDETTANPLSVAQSLTTYGTHSFTASATAYGQTSTASCSVRMELPLRFGFDAEETASGLNITSLALKSLKASPSGNYTLTNSVSGNHLWLCVPSSMTISSVVSGSFDVPMLEAETLQTSLGNYKCYRSASESGINAGTMTITIA